MQNPSGPWLSGQIRQGGYVIFGLIQYLAPLRAEEEGRGA